MKFFIRFATIISILILVSIIGLSIKNMIKEAANVKTAEMKTARTAQGNLLNSPTFNDEIKEILRYIDRNEYPNARKSFDEHKESWKETDPGDATIVREYLQDYFDLKYALEFCLENKTKLESAKSYLSSKGISKIARKFLNSSLSQLEEEKYEKNSYLRGEKKLDIGTMNFIKDIEEFASFFKQNLESEIPVYNILITLFKYDNKFNIKNPNFIKLTQTYEDFMIINRHPSTLTQKDSTVLCMRISYMLSDIVNEKKNDSRKKNCQGIISEIDKLTDTYPDYIGNKGTLMPERDYLRDVKEISSKIETSDKSHLKEYKDEAKKRFSAVPNLI